MLKSFSEGISTGTDSFQTDLSQRLIWKGYRTEADILTIPEEYRTAVQQRLVETDPEKIKEISGYRRTAKQKKIMSSLTKGKREEALRREIEAGAKEGEWSRFKVGLHWMVRFPGLVNLAPPKKAMVREATVEKIENKFQVGRAAIGRAVSKAATRQMLTQLEAKIMKELSNAVWGMREKILWPKVEKVVKEVAKKGEYYHKDKGWY